MPHIVVWCTWCDTKFKHNCDTDKKCKHFPCRCWEKKNSQFTLGQHRITTQHLFVSRWTVLEEFLIDSKYHLHCTDSCTRYNQSFVPKSCTPYVQVNGVKVHNHIPGPCQCVPNIFEVDNTCNCIKIDSKLLWEQCLREIRGCSILNRI